MLVTSGIQSTPGMQELRDAGNSKDVRAPGLQFHASLPTMVEFFYCYFWFVVLYILTCAF